MEENTALFVMDMQAPMLAMYPEIMGFVPNVKKAIAHARNKKIPVIYVVIGFRPGAPEATAAMRDRFGKMNMEEWVKILPELAPQEGEITITKRRVSAFTGSDLEVVLRATGIKHMILTGIATSGVVLSTACEASDKDYRISVLSDCCADPDPETHKLLTTKFFPRRGTVLTVDEWCK